MKKMAMALVLVLLMSISAMALADTLKVGMECNYAPYNWTQSEASDEAVAIAAGGYADGYDVRIAKRIVYPRYIFRVVAKISGKINRVQVDIKIKSR